MQEGRGGLKAKVEAEIKLRCDEMKREEKICVCTLIIIP